MPEGYTSEKFIRVYDDKHGFYTQIGPDGDGLDLAEMLYIEEDKKVSFVLDKRHMVETAKAILELYGNEE